MMSDISRVDAEPCGYSPFLFALPGERIGLAADLTQSPPSIHVSKRLLFSIVHEKSGGRQTVLAITASGQGQAGLHFSGFYGVPSSASNRARIVSFHPKIQRQGIFTTLQSDSSPKNQGSAIIYSASCHSKTCMMLYFQWHIKGEFLGNVNVASYINISLCSEKTGQKSPCSKSSEAMITLHVTMENNCLVINPQ